MDLIRMSVVPPGPSTPLPVSPRRDQLGFGMQISANLSAGTSVKLIRGEFSRIERLQEFVYNITSLTAQQCNASAHLPHYVRARVHLTFLGCCDVEHGFCSPEAKPRVPFVPSGEQTTHVPHHNSQQLLNEPLHVRIVQTHCIVGQLAKLYTNSYRRSIRENSPRMSLTEVPALRLGEICIPNPNYSRRRQDTGSGVEVPGGTTDMRIKSMQSQTFFCLLRH